ncbi:D-alanyl-D-alanine carboxypeptidase family protein [Clostridium sp. JS66]|uniref:D-alanyl-D-alanine carboxypeptidase family protein n=1 Tax=Clostridium sp. JS66 TaxID=3064705 RepID=UPI00298D89EE|nr:D-alanyl-D-alanine carboxypeptidase family protein [Clostridium sp. JS66]WPC42908.1 D-alanyl-D-alanine carboxypeptidase family protein [Clostridium sp. JS66]
MKKLLIFMMSFVFLLSSAPLKAQAKADPPTVSADSVVLMDAITGYVLYGKNEDSAYPPASTTKLMTALLTLEKCKLDDVVTVGKNPPLVDGSKIYLFEGEQLKVRDLLYGLMLQSGNDCAEALAEHIGGGSIDNFVVLMNKRALELGCRDTNFVNPSGLYNEKHKTSARDLALIMRELSNKAEYTQIASTSFYEIAPTNKSAAKRPLWNENKLIQKSSQLYYDGCKGGKTGYTIQSEHSYVSYATRNGQRLIVSLVHDKNKTFFPDAVNLFNYGFSTFESVPLYKKGDLVATYSNNGVTVPLLAASDFYYVKLKEDTTVPKFVLKDENLSTKFFKTGDTIAEGTVVKNNQNLGTLKLTSGTSHELKQVLQSSPFKSMNLKMEYLIPAILVIIGGAIFMFKKYNLFNKLFKKE